MLLENTERNSAAIVAENRRRRWAMICEDLKNPDVELTAEEFAPVLAAFHGALLAGVEFDRGFIAIMALLERQMIGGDEDTDSDQADWLISEDEPGTEDTILLHPHLVHVDDDPHVGVVELDEDMEDDDPIGETISGGPTEWTQRQLTPNERGEA